MPRQYYTERLGKTEPKSIDEETFRRLIKALYHKFERQGYFQTAFGFECVDAGYVAGDVGTTLDEHLTLRFPGRDISIKSEDLDKLFDLIEYLYDHVAKPTESNYHGFANCGPHVVEGSYEEGKKEWREECNEILENMDPAYRITDEGLIEQLPQSGLRQLTDERESFGDEENVDQRIDRACRLFFGRQASSEDKRNAIRELADVLEYLRDELKEKIPNWEENRLFEIANQYGIRHHSEGQETQYDKEAYYPWIFHSYLATIDLLGRLSIQED